MQVFDEIEVVPTSELYCSSMYARGGPVWPDFERQTLARHLFDGDPIDLSARPVDGPHARIDRPCVWVGYARPHFGHFVAEYATRLPVSVQERPDDLYLFTLHPAMTPESVPEFFWAVLAWYGIDRAQVLFVTRPLRVRRLRVAPQGEHLRQSVPDPGYLDLLDRNAARNALQPVVADLLYVARVNLLQKGLGGHAGEGYLVSVLRRLGCAILDPAVAPLEHQLARYAGARHIVFAEGSAVHGRQLLGRIDQRVTVLLRRPRSSIARAMLEPRCRRLDYGRVTAKLTWPMRLNGTRWHARSISFYDDAALIATFGDIGLDLTPHWSDEDFRSARAADAADWLRKVISLRRTVCPQATRQTVARVFDAYDLGHLLDAEPPAASPKVH